nr:MAG TPA: hypothetical protein [Caudoviricetes sp.]
MPYSVLYLMRRQSILYLLAVANGNIKAEMNGAVLYVVMSFIQKVVGKSLLINIAPNVAQEWRLITMINPYKISLLNAENRIYGVEYKDKRYKMVGFPDSWGSKLHAQKYMAALLGLTLEEFRATKFTKS